MGLNVIYVKSTILVSFILGVFFFLIGIVNCMTLAALLISFSLSKHLPTYSSIYYNYINRIFKVSYYGTSTSLLYNVTIWRWNLSECCCDVFNGGMCSSHIRKFFHFQFALGSGGEIQIALEIVFDWVIDHLCQYVLSLLKFDFM